MSNVEIHEHQHDEPLVKRLFAIWSIKLIRMDAFRNKSQSQF